MSNETLVDVETLRTHVRDKYRDVAEDPHGAHHFHTGRPLASRLGYDHAVVDALPDRAVESFAGVGNPFSLRRLKSGSRVVDVGSGAGFDSFIAYSDPEYSPSFERTRSSVNVGSANAYIARYLARPKRL